MELTFAPAGVKCLLLDVVVTRSEAPEQSPAGGALLAGIASLRLQ
jgi:hypothetical protein